ncbi:MAG: hypothetical protein JO134_21540 [Xanthobacteraceae bacterium]|nr:hypothetical protein [Xanthobacteraceae bacterium]
MAGARDQGLLAKIKQQPLMFFVATGPANACGPGCSSWIAADGYFDSDAGKRFRDFLSEPARRELPVFFNSLGGVASQAVAIGLAMREYRMRAGVARTMPEGCRPAPALNDACRRSVVAGSDQKTKLLPAGSHCASACVYALLGASVRQVASTAELGVHSIRFIWALSNRAPTGPPPSTDVVDGVLRNYMVEMGVDPGLIDAAAKVSPDRIHWLSRAEISKFGIETRDFYETPWVGLQETPSIFSVSKSWSRMQPSGEERTSVMRIRCATPSGYLLVYRSELPLLETNARLAVRLGWDDGDISFGSSAAIPGGSIFYSRIPDDLMQRAASQRKLQVSETRGSTELGNFSVSTAGFAAAVNQLQMHCNDTDAAAAVKLP